ncbi:MAG: SHOCT domain-containing protein [Terriglobales bacterium]
MKHKLIFILSVVLVGLACASLVWRQHSATAAARQTKQLAMLKELRDRGVLSEDEYQAKAKVLLAIAPAGSRSWAGTDKDKDDDIDSPTFADASKSTQSSSLDNRQVAGDDDGGAAGGARLQQVSASAAPPISGAQSGSAQQNQLDSLRELRENGLLTDEEYRAKVQALTAGASQAAGAFANGATRTVEISDQQLGMRAATLQIPADWKFAGIIDRSRGCHGTGPEAKTVAESADGLTGIEVYPSLGWTYGNGSGRQAANRNGCGPMPMSTAAEFLQRIVLPTLRPNATLDQIGPLYPEGQAAVRDALHKMQEGANAEFNQFRSLYVRPAEHILDGAIARVHYTVNGHEVDETIGTRVHCAARYFRNGYQPRFCNSYPLIILRAPRGTLEQTRPRLLAINRTYRMEPAWDQRMAMITKQQSDAMIANSNAQFQASQAASQRAADIRTQTWQQNEQARADSVANSINNSRAQQNAMNESAHATALYAGDQRAFINPQNGTEYDLSNKYSYSYLSPDGSHYAQTNDATAGSPWIGGTQLTPK